MSERDLGDLAAGLVARAAPGEHLEVAVARISTG